MAWIQCGFMCAWQRLSCFLMSMALISPLFTQTTTRHRPNLALYDLGPVSSLCLSFPICKVDRIMAPTLQGCMRFNITTCVILPGLVCISEVTQSCPTLCDPMDCSPPGSSIHGILQARILEWVAISFSRGSSRPRDRTQVSRIAGRHFYL